MEIENIIDKPSPIYVYLICAALIIGVFGIFFQVRSHEFVSFDDADYITTEQHVNTGLKFENIAYFFKNQHSNNFHPLTSISHMLDVQLFGLKPGPHHLVNVILHALNAAGLFLVLFYMTKRIWPCAFVAAVFAFHPLRVESVAWAAERKDVLSTFFWILTLGAYVYYVRRKTILSYLPIIALYILAALSKPMVVTLPVLMLFLDYWPLGRYDFSEEEKLIPKHLPKRIVALVLEKIPLFIIAAGASIATFMVQQSTGLAKSAAEFPLQWRIWNMFYAYTRYIGKLFWPVDLAIFYPYPGKTLAAWQIAGSILLIIFISIFALMQFKKRPYIIVGWLWFLVMLIPVIGLVQVGLQAMADRYTYMSFTGLVILITWGAAEFINTRNSRIAAVAASFVILVSLAGAEYKQVTYWQNSETLYTHGIKAVEGNWWCYDMLGMELAKHGKNQEALDCFRKSLDISSDNINTKFERGKALLTMGKPDEAIAIFESYLPKVPQNAEQVDWEEHLYKASKISEMVRLYIETHFTCASAYAAKGDYDNAIRHYKEVLRVAPKMAKAYKGLGDIYLAKGDLQQTADLYSAFIQLHPEEVTAVIDLSYKLNEQSKPEQSEVILKKIMQIAPDNADLHSALGISLGQQGKFVQAEQEFQKGIALKPASSEIESNFGFALACQNKFPEAIAHFERALKLDPLNTVAKEHLDRAREYLKKQAK